MSLSKFLENPMHLLECIEDEIPRNLVNRINQFRNGVFYKRQSNNTVYLDINLPGVPLNNIDVVVEDGTIAVNVNNGNDIRTEDMYVHKFSGLSRTYKLPVGVSDDSVSADYHDGVLTLSYQVPITSSNGSRRIMINTSSNTTNNSMNVINNNACSSDNNATGE